MLSYFILQTVFLFGDFENIRRTVPIGAATLGIRWLQQLQKKAAVRVRSKNNKNKVKSRITDIRGKKHLRADKIYYNFITNICKGVAFLTIDGI